MADALKIAGQSNPLAATLTTLYTVPASTSFSGNLYVCNRSATATTFRVAEAIAGAADDNKQYIAYDTPIAGNQVINFTGLSYAATDVVRVYATLATVSFTLRGVEVT